MPLSLLTRAGALSRLVLAAFILVSAVAVAAPPERLRAGGSWAALRFDGRCDAGARPLLPAAREEQARAGFSFAPARRRIGEFHVRLSRVPRPGASIMLTVGDRPFLLAGRGAWAWGRSPAQDAAILAAVRDARSMRVQSRDASGRRFTDRYLLDGAPTAIDAAAAACAGKIQP